MPVPEPLPLAEPFTVADAARRGVGRSVVRRLVAGGLVRPVMHGVFVDSGARDTTQLRAAALMKIAPPNSVVCDRTAAWLHGVDILAERDPLWLPPLDVFRTGGDDGLRRDGCLRGKRALDPEVDVELVNGVSVTTPLRTACDLGRLRTRRDAFVALNALAAHGGFGRIEVSIETGRFKGMRGVVQLRALARILAPAVESPAESVVLLQILDAGLPEPEAQFPILSPAGVLMYRLDFAYRSIKLALEYDGEEHHSSPEQREHDQRRRNYLSTLGWTFVVLTKDDVYATDPRAASIVREAIAHAHQRLDRPA